MEFWSSSMTSLDGVGLRSPRRSGILLLLLLLWAFCVDGIMMILSSSSIEELANIPGSEWDPDPWDSCEEERPIVCDSVAGHFSPSR